MCCTMLIFLLVYLVVCDMNCLVMLLSTLHHTCILYTITSSNGLVLWYVEHFHLLGEPIGLMFGLCMDSIIPEHCQNSVIGMLLHVNSISLSIKFAMNLTAQLGSIDFH